MKALNRFGLIYTIVMVLSSFIPIFFTIQFFMAVPELRSYFYFDLLVPIIGIGTGVYGLWKTKDEIDAEEVNK